jgi:hypothetical protein
MADQMAIVPYEGKTTKPNSPPRVRRASPPPKQSVRKITTVPNAPAETFRDLDPADPATQSLLSDAIAKLQHDEGELKAENEELIAKVLMLQQMTKNLEEKVSFRHKLHEYITQHHENILELANILSRRLQAKKIRIDSRSRRPKMSEGQVMKIITGLDKEMMKDIGQLSGKGSITPAESAILKKQIEEAKKTKAEVQKMISDERMPGFANAISDFLIDCMFLLLESPAFFLRFISSFLHKEILSIVSVSTIMFILNYIVDICILAVSEGASPSKGMNMTALTGGMKKKQTRKGKKGKKNYKKTLKY